MQRIRNTFRTRPSCLLSPPAVVLLIGASVALPGGCATDRIERPGAESLRRAVLEQSRAQLTEAGEEAEPREVTRTPSELNFTGERLDELNQMAGPASHALDRAPPLGPDLRGKPSDVLPLSLNEAVISAIEANLDIRSARLNPALGRQQLIAAQAAFDWTLFADATYAHTDQPQVIPVLNGVALGSSAREQDRYAFSAGLRKQLTTGGLVEIRQDIGIDDDTGGGVSLDPDPARTTALNLTLSQPLLRGFGEDVSLAEIRLAESRRRADVNRLEGDLLRLVAETANVYWNLALAHYNLMVERRLLDRGIQTRDVLQGRLDFDVKPAEYSDAVARVESRKARVLRAENNVRLVSDRLKGIINHPRYPVSGEGILAPTDRPVDEPIAFDLVESLNTGLRGRPEIALALNAIEDAAIREALAADAKLPQLDFTFQVGLNGLDDDLADAFSEQGEAEFVNYTAGLAFEQALGNRAPEAIFRLRRIERLQSVIAHRSAVQDVILEIKAALRNVETNYRLIEQTRASRLAASENLRTLQVEEETTRAMTPSFLDLKLTRQESLAQAELEEAAALANYVSSIANLQSATGVALSRYGLTLVVPDEQEVDELLERLPPIDE